MDSFHPVISQWFNSHYESEMPVQTESWKLIAQDQHVLISAPTGSGKTLAAFLWSINSILQSKLLGENKRILYVSPLRALNNDIHRNLLTPLEEIYAISKEHLPDLIPRISVGVRSGDSSSYERAKLIKYPPDIFITTPEAINIMLTSEKGRGNLQGISTVIIDEIHILAGSKRGTLFMTNIERLEEIIQRASAKVLHRIAVSATIRPLEEVAAFLGGFDNGGKPRSVAIVHDDRSKNYCIKIKLGAPQHSSWWDRQIPLIASEIEKHTCTLIFCNNRRAAERAAHLLNEYFNTKLVFAHHSSLSREYRYWVEQELKEGRLRAVTATSSLELGIDIGSIDQVLLIQTPFTMSAAIQRIGRSNHQVNQNSMAAFIPLHPRDILRASVQSRGVILRDIEPVFIPRNCLDVLAQIILSETAGRRTPLNTLKMILRRSWSFHHLSDLDFDRVLEMLAGRYEESRVHELKPRIVIHSDEEHTVEGRKANRFLIYQGGGTIPNRGYFDMYISSSQEKIGELDEEFVFERSLYDRFTLGNRVWTIDEIDNQKVLVSPSTQSSMFVPFWKADSLGMDAYFARKVNIMLEILNLQLKDDASKLTGALLQKLGGQPSSPHSGLSEFHLDEESVKELVYWLQRQVQESASDLPHRHHILIEQLTDFTITPDTIHFVMHTNWGASTNAALMFCLQAKFRQVNDVSLQALYTDEAVICSLPLEYDGFDIMQDIRPREIVTLLGEQLAGTGLFGSRFRMNAARALLVLRRGFNQRTPLWLQRMKSRELLERVIEFQDFPIVQETWRELLEQDLSVCQLHSYLHEIEDGSIGISYIRTKMPTPFASDLLWQLKNEYLYQDDSLGSAHSVSPDHEILQRFVNETWKRPDIPETLWREYLRKRRRLVEEYQPENTIDLQFYFQDRRIFTREEREEVLSILSPHLSVSEQMDEQFYTVTLSTGAQLWLNKDIAQQMVEQQLEMLVLEWFDWQAFTSQEQLDIWGNKVIKKLTDDGLIASWHNEYIKINVLERLLRMRRSWLRREQQALSRESIQYRSALLNKIRMYSFQHQSDPPADEDRNSFEMLNSRPPEMAIDDVLVRLSGVVLPAWVFIHGYFPARLGRVNDSMLEGSFHRNNMIWTGTHGKRIIISPNGELAKYLQRYKSTNDLSKDLDGLLPPGAGRYSFHQIHSFSDLTNEVLQKKLQKLIFNGQIASDSWSVIAEIAGKNRWTLTGHRAHSMSRYASQNLRVVKLGRRHRTEWQSRYNIPGLWFRINDWKQPSNPEESLEDIKLHIYQLFRRHPLLSKEIVNDEGTSPTWQSMLPVLRQMELAGEVVGGKICNDLSGLQFMLDYFEPVIEQNAWFWLHSYDPALLPNVHNKRGDHNYMLFRVQGETALPLMFVKNSGKDIELLDTGETLLASVLKEFFYTVLLEDSKKMVRLVTINGKPVSEHSLFVALKEQGFMEDKQVLTLWKY